VRKIPLGGRKGVGRVALVDDEDYDFLMRYRWFVQEDINPAHRSGPYARTESDGKHLFMHNLLVDYPKPDHIDGDGLNNQKSNLRPATPSQSAMNRGNFSGTSSRYKGVTWGKRNWAARITCNGETYNLGRFQSEVEAAVAYDTAARELFGEYARLNFPHGRRKDFIFCDDLWAGDLSSLPASPCGLPPHSTSAHPG
jgi:hypothetical protein